MNQGAGLEITPDELLMILLDAIKLIRMRP